MTILSTGIATSFIDFTRASNATVTDSDGKVKWAPHNLLTNSESFDASAWTKYLAPITANAQVAPNGTTTADTVTTSDNYSSVNQTLAVLTGATYTLAFYAKRGTMTDAKLSVRDVNNAADIVAATSYYSAINSSTWSLVTQSFTVPAGCTTITVHVLKESFASGTIHLWGAHLYHSDLGGMQPNTSAYPMYNPTTPKNLLGYTEDLGFASVWAPTRSTVATSAVTAPNGILNARTITATSGTSGTHYVRQVMTLANSLHVLSVYAKVGTRSWLLLNNTSVANSSAYFDLSNGTTGTVGAAATASVTSIGDGWYRCSILFTAAAGSNELRIAVATADATASFTSDGTETINLWGAQLSDSASLDSYSPVYGAAVTSAAYYGPRRDFDGATLACKGLLVEEQRTNSLLHTAAFDQSPWTSQAFNAGSVLPTVTPNTAIAPDGTQTADTISFGSVSSGSINRRIQTSSQASGTNTFTGSVWLKLPSGTATVYLWLDDGTSGASVGDALISLTTTWRRFFITATVSPSQPGNMRFSIAQKDGSTLTAFDVHAWGAQLELGSFATSYIPVGATTAGATRNADVASVSTQAFPYSATEGTLVVSYSRPTAPSFFQVALAFGPVAAGSLVSASGEQSTAWYANGVNPAGVVDGTNKVGIAFNSTGAFAAVANGGTAASSSSSDWTGTSTSLNIGNRADNARNLNGHIRQITYLPRRVSNAELVTRST